MSPCGLGVAGLRLRTPTPDFQRKYPDFVFVIGRREPILINCNHIRIHESGTQVAYFAICPATNRRSKGSSSGERGLLFKRNGRWTGEMKMPDGRTGRTDSEETHCQGGPETQEGAEREGLREGDGHRRQGRVVGKANVRRPRPSVWPPQKAKTEFNHPNHSTAAYRIS